MRMPVSKYIMRIGILAIITTGLLTGCGTEKKVDYTIEGMTETKQPQSEGGKTGLDQFEDGELWEETWASKSGATEWDITDVVVDAKITVPKTKSMSVIEVMEPEFDEAYKEKIAKSVFDTDEIYYGDVFHLPKKDLEKLRDFYGGGWSMTIDTQEKATEYNTNMQAFEYAWKNNNLENAKDTYTPVEKYDGNEYIGTYGGQRYKLTFAEDKGDDIFKKRVKQIILETNDLWEVCPDKFKGIPALVYGPWMKGDFIENKCQISEEEALEIAKEAAEKWGMDYSVISYTRPLMWGTPPENYSFASEEEPDDWGVNGYVFSFDLGVDDISFVNFGTEEDYSEFWQYTDDSEERQYSLKARLQVYVTDKGVIRMEANNPLEITGISENVELLPLNTIKSIIKEELNKQWETFRFDSYSTKYMDGMELIYFRVRDKENPGKYSYVPTWRLATVTKDTVLHLITIRNHVLINAIDGSVIDFYDET